MKRLLLIPSTRQEWIDHKVLVELSGMKSYYEIKVLDLSSFYNYGQIVEGAEHEIICEKSYYKDGFYNTNSINKFLMTAHLFIKLLLKGKVRRDDVVLFSTSIFLIRIIKLFLRVRLVCYLRTVYPGMGKGSSLSDRLIRRNPCIGRIFKSLVPMYADVYLASGLMHKEMILRLFGNGAPLAIVGPSFLTSLKKDMIEKNDYATDLKNVVYIMQGFYIHGEIEAHQQQINFINELIKLKKEGIINSLTLRPHPRDNLNIYENSLDFKCIDHFDFSDFNEFAKNFLRNSYIVGFNSTLLFECGFLGGRVAILVNEFFYNRFRSFYDYLGTDVVDVEKFFLSLRSGKRFFLSQKTVDKVYSSQSSCDLTFDEIGVYISNLKK